MEIPEKYVRDHDYGCGGPFAVAESRSCRDCSGLLAIRELSPNKPVMRECRGMVVESQVGCSCLLPTAINQIGLSTQI
jgi:hypothetical protein